MKVSDLMEAHVDDMYPKQFKNFRQKYAKVRGKKKLYVQFTNHKNNTLDKTAFNNPTDHNDFVGVYAYPLEYVLNFPMDVWYASNAKYLRVMEYQTSNELDFTGMSESYADSILQKFPNDYFRGTGLTRNTVLDDIVKEYNFKGRNRWGRALLFLIQHDIVDGWFSDKTRSGKEQTELVRKLGYDVVVDRSKSNKTATINDREPEQIIFLSRKSFKVIDIFTLSGNDITDINTSGKTIDDKFSRKLAAKITVAIGTTISDVVRENFKYIVWTKRGEQITINIHNTSSALDANKKGLDINMGEKPHRYHKDTDSNTATVEVNSIRGKLNATLGEKDKIDDVVSVIEKQYSSNDVDMDFKPVFKSDYEKKLKDAENKQQIDDKNRIMMRQKNKYNNLLKPKLEKYGMDTLVSYGDKDNNSVAIYELLQGYFKNDHKEYSNFKEFIDGINELVDSVDEDESKQLMKSIFLHDVDDKVLPYIEELVDKLESDGVVFHQDLDLQLARMRTE